MTDKVETPLDLIKRAFDESEMPYVVRERGEYSYFFIGDDEDLLRLSVDQILGRGEKFMEFENGFLVSA
ncbi:hypothetical protein RYA05_00805 [Pseudomonas syringae pv. actinidiae]|nr:hypothetical protein [Pseudomonas syringae pv. actinidiae]